MQNLKSLILPQLIWLWYFYYNIWTCFYLRYVFEESEVIAWKGSVKEFSKIPQNSLGNIFAGVSFTIRLQTGGLQFHEIQNLVQVLYCKVREIFKKFYFANVCESLLLKKKIFTGVSFHKTLGFLSPQTKLFYYERTSSYIPFKTPERKNRVIFQNLCGCCVWNSRADENMLKIPSRQKHVQSRHQRNVSGMLFGYLYNKRRKYFWSFWWSLIFINLQVLICLRPATLSKKRLWHRCVPVNFAKFLRTPFFTSGRLLLKFVSSLS